MLATRGVTVRFGDVTAVKDVDIEVADGQVLALLGPSGCGKSTLLRAVAGLEPVSAGAVLWAGQDLARVPVHRRGFGLMFQDGVLFPHRTVAGNVGYGLRGGHERNRVDQLLALVGLPGYGPRRVTTLSGGQAQRVALARALAPRPRLLLLDEPLAALDQALRDSLLADLGLVIQETGTTAIFVTHDQHEAFAIADRVALMRRGEIVQCGPPAEVWGHPASAWAAEFFGCAAVVTRGTQQVGLRPAALVVDPAGTIVATVHSVTPGLDQQRIRVVIDHGQDVLTGGGPPSGEQDMTIFQAVADPTCPVSRGGQVRLRFNPAETVPIGPLPEPGKILTESFR